MPAYYSDLGDGRYASDPSTAGPWSPTDQHGGPPSALLGGAMAAVGARDDMVVARVTCEILGPVKVADLAVSVRVTRPGRRVERVTGAVVQDGRTVLEGSLWRIARADRSTPDQPAPQPVPAPRDLDGRGGYLGSVEWAPLHGSFDEPGPCAVWTRLRGEVVAGLAPTPLQRVLAVADSGNGVSSVFPLESTFFINPELTVHLTREPEGEWVLLDAETVVDGGGCGLAASVLSDRRGRIGRGAQALLVSGR